MKVPCLLCEKRTLGCHAQCPDYKGFRRELEDVREKERADARIGEFFAEKTHRLKKEYWHKKGWI